MKLTVNKTIQVIVCYNILLIINNLQVFTGSRTYQKDDDMDPKKNWTPIC